MTQIDKISKVQQKRNRIPLSCSNCRKKKIKCDRTKPRCKVCEAHGLTNCEYFGKPEEQSAPNSEAKLGTKEKYNQAISIKSLENPILTKPTTPDLSIENKEMESVKAQLKELAQSLAAIQQTAAAGNSSNFVSPASNTSSEHQNMNSKIIPDFLQPLISNFSVKSTYDSDDAIAKSAEINVMQIRKLIQNLRINSFDRIKIYGFYSEIQKAFMNNSRMHNFGPFSWVTIILKDPLSPPISLAVIEANKNMSSTFQKKATVAKSKYFVSSPDVGEIKKLSDNKFESFYDEIIAVLPTKKGIWLFVDRFFEFVYPFIPFVDQNSFIKDIERILNSNSVADRDSEEKVSKISTPNDADVAILGTLLIIIQFAYDSLLTCVGEKLDSLNNGGYEPYLSSFEIKENLINYSQLCLNEFKLLRKCPLPVIQCAILLKEYQKFNCSDGFSDGDSQIYTGLLIQMAISIGLNRDPVVYDKALDDDTSGLLWRKIWFHLISADNYHYMQSGSPPMICFKHYDTEFPTFRKNISNIKNLELEKVTIELMKERFEVETKMRDVANLVSDMHKTPNVEELLIKAFALSADLESRYESLNAVLTRNTFGDHCENVRKLGQWMIYMNALTLLQPVFTHIYSHYQLNKRFDASLFFHNKVSIIWLEVVANLPKLVKSGSEFFGFGFDVFIPQTFEIFIHKGLIFQVSSYVKANIWRDKLKRRANEQNAELIRTIDTFKDDIIIKFISDFHVPALRSLSKRYFHVWRMFKCHSYILYLLKEQKLSFEKEQNIYNFFEYLSLDNLKMLMQTTNISYYKAGAEVPTWFVDWKQNYNNFVYYGPGNNPISTVSTINYNTDSEDSHSQPDLYHCMSYADDIWLDKMFRHYCPTNTVSTAKDPVDTPLGHMFSPAPNEKLINGMSSTKNQDTPTSSIFNNPLQEPPNDGPTINIDNSTDIFRGFGGPTLDFDNMFWFN